MFKLDDRDIKILSILEREGRISNTVLAKRVSLSSTACWERVKRLEKYGIISNYRAQIALTKIAEHITVFVVAELEKHRAEDFNLFEDSLNDEKEITNAWALAGGYDYLLQVITRNINTYQCLIDRLLDRQIGLKRYFTYVVTKEIKSQQELPLHELVK